MEIGRYYQLIPPEMLVRYKIKLGQLEQCSYHDPDDGIVTPQESEVRQQQSRKENDEQNISRSKRNAQYAAFGAGAGVSANEPITTAIAGGTFLYSVGDMKESYATKEEAQARYEQKVEEEKQYLNEVKQQGK